MTELMKIKQKHDMDALLRAVHPAMVRNVARRRKEEARKARINRMLRFKGSFFRVV